jgi:integrase
LPERAVSEATKQQYGNDFKLMVERGSGQFHPEEGTQSKRTFYRRRAAATFCCQRLLGWGLAEQDKAQKAGDWGKVVQLVGSLEFALSILERYPPQKTAGDALKAGAVCPIEDPKPRHSKRQGLAHLPADWRQRMWEIIPSASKYRAAIAVLQLAGARPSELEGGVEVFAEYDGSLRVAIHGTKRGVDVRHGRETRIITIANDTPAAMWLWKTCMERDGFIAVRIVSPRRLADEVTRLGRRLWPRKKDTVSPYSYRHAFAADVKTQFPDDWDTIAAALGHSVPETQRLYGRAQQSRGGGARFLEISATPSPKGERAKKMYPGAAERDPPMSRSRPRP